LKYRPFSRTSPKNKSPASFFRPAAPQKMLARLFSASFGFMEECPRKFLKAAEFLYFYVFLPPRRPSLPIRVIMIDTVYNRNIARIREL
jgi:hypothetical protein